MLERCRVRTHVRKHVGLDVLPPDAVVIEPEHVEMVVRRSRIPRLDEFGELLVGLRAPGEEADLAIAAHEWDEELGLRFRFWPVRLNRREEMADGEGCTARPSGRSSLVPQSQHRAEREDGEHEARKRPHDGRAPLVPGNGRDGDRGVGANDIEDRVAHGPVVPENAPS